MSRSHRSTIRNVRIPPIHCIYLLQYSSFTVYARTPTFTTLKPLYFNSNNPHEMSQPAEVAPPIADPLPPLITNYTPFYKMLEEMIELFLWEGKDAMQISDEFSSKYGVEMTGQFTAVVHDFTLTPKHGPSPIEFAVARMRPFRLIVLLDGQWKNASQICDELNKQGFKEDIHFVEEFLRIGASF